MITMDSNYQTDYLDQSDPNVSRQTHASSSLACIGTRGLI